MSITPVSKVGEWKTIQQRELKAAGARKKQRRALAAAGTAAGAAGALAARNPGAARAAMGQARNVRNLPKGTRAAGVGRMARANPTGAAITGLAGASGAALGVAGSQRGVEAYHQHKINQRRRANHQSRVSKMEPVIPASRRRPQVAARNAVRRPNRKKNPLLDSVSKKEWSDRRLAGHKRAQSYLSAGGATLGIGALGAAGVAAATKNPRAAQRLTRLTGKSASKIREQANRASPALTTGSAGVGGVGGFNFAAIQSQEAKRGQKVKKSMSISVWGIDHGEPVAKNDERWGRAERTAAALGGAGGALSYNSPLGAAASGIYGGTQARRGRKAAVGVRTAGRSLVEGTAGGFTGAALGAAVSRGRLAGLGAIGGTAAGTAHGAGAAMSNARRRGDLKSVSKSDEEDRLAAQRYADRASAYAVGGAAGGAAAGAAYGPARRAGQSARAGYRLSRGLGSGRVRSVGSAARVAGAGARGGRVSRLATGIGAVGGLYGGVGTAGAKNLREETRRRQNG